MTPKYSIFQCLLHLIPQPCCLQLRRVWGFMAYYALQMIRGSAVLDSLGAAWVLKRVVGEPTILRLSSLC